MSVYQPKRCQLIATILMVACAVPVISQAQMYELCPAFLPERPLITALPLDTPTVAEADQAEYDREGNVILTGNAQIRRPTEQISGEFLQYQSHPEEISGRGNLWYETPSFLVKAQSAVIEPAREQGRLEDAIYWLVDHHATGKARYVEQLTASRFRLRQATYSTCPVTQRDWELRASRIDLNRDRGRGLARHTTLRLGNVPVLYLPLVSFPIDDRRQTGFLYPSVGNSSSSGFEISTPWYWNIAPHTDATLTPRFISRRGLGLDSEWRYLHRRGYGEVHFNLLPNDRVYGETRWQGQLRHAAQWRHDFSTELLVNRVSDDHYFRDFSNSLEDAATDNIESAFRVRYRVGSWQLGLLAQQYQTVNPLINKPWYPYRIMPRVTANTSTSLNTAGPDLQLTFRSELTRFDHLSKLRTTGQRLRATPTLSSRYERPYLEVTPRITLDLSHYKLSRNEREQGLPSTISRSLPLISLDTRLFLERSYGDGRFLGLLEPRLYYLYVPYRDQSDIPLFDTGRATFSFAQLFQPNRYTGGDRIGDANQLTYALAWSLIDTRQGLETLAIRLAQQYRFQDAKVTLGREELRSGPSTVLGEIASQFHRNWQASITTEYDSDQSRISRSHSYLRYRGDGGGVLNLSYTYSHSINVGGANSYRQADVSFAYPASRQWTLLGRVGYAFDENRLIQSLAGIRYESCCWALRIAAQRYVVNSDSENERRYRNSVMLQLELKGLGNLGRSGVLDDAILGYRP